jgi:CubicO group peptidase (beta-lactamase class C family)
MKPNQLKISTNRSFQVQFILTVTMLTFILSGLSSDLFSQTNEVLKRLKGFDKYMDRILKDWNIAGAGVGIVYKDKMIFAKGYGYRDYGQKLPVTPTTLFQIASNTKLFTAVSIGMLVDQGKLDWDKPVRNYVPSIEFYNSDLNNTVTICDKLSDQQM